MIPKKIYVPKNSIKCLCHYDNSALALVTNSQKTGSVEYTDLSQVWHPAEEEPTKEQAVLYVTKNGKIAVLNRVNVGNWDWYVDKYSIILWCYTEDVLPKGDKKWAI